MLCTARICASQCLSKSIFIRELFSAAIHAERPFYMQIKISIFRVPINTEDLAIRFSLCSVRKNKNKKKRRLFDRILLVWLI
jgi:hypothetical protein